MTLASILLGASKSERAGITFVYADEREERVTYGDLLKNAVKILGSLQSMGIKEQDELIIQIEENNLLLYTFWACILGGIIPVPLSYGVEKDQGRKLLGIWRSLSSPYWICDDDQFQKTEEWVTSGEHATGFGMIRNKRISIREMIVAHRDGIISDLSDEDIAYVQYSSGSTSEPKGVPLTHKSLLCNISAIVESIGIGDRDILLSWMPLTHDMGMIGFHLTGVFLGIDVVCMQTSLFVRRPLAWMDKASQVRANVLYSPNFGLYYFLSALKGTRSDWDLSCVRSIINGAELISMRLCTEFQAALSNYGLGPNVILTAYGMAEACVEVTSMPVSSEIRCYYLDRNFLNIGDPIAIRKENESEGIQFVDVGYPVTSCQIRIADDENRAFDEGVIGHIQIRGANIFTGYYNDPGNTARAFTADGWLKTGDLGFIRNGRLTITGRFKNLIIINGKNYYPQDIESILVDSGICAFGKVVACAARDADDLTDELIVFVLHRGNAGAFDVVAKRIKEAIFTFMQIRVDEVVAVRRIPRTTSGKIQNYVLVGEYLKNKVKGKNRGVEGLGRTSDLEDQLVRYCRDLLANDHIGAHSHLLEYGLNSLSAVRLAIRSCELTGKEVPMDFIFGHDTVAEIIRGPVMDGDRMALPKMEAGAKRGYSKASSAQVRIWMEFQLSPETSAYNIPVILKITGTLDVFALEAAMRELIRKYEILRTSFVWDGEMLWQREHDYSEALFSVRYFDLRSSDSRNDEVIEICRQAANKAFDLNEPAPLSMVVVRETADSYKLAFVIHHIIIDGWSLNLLFSELSLRYNKGGKEEDPPLQFSVYSEWLDSVRSQGFMESDRLYWLDELAGLPDPVEPGWVRRKADRNGPIRIDSVEERFTDADRELLRTVALKLKTTPFSILMALLNILCLRYTSKRDIVFGFDVTGRVTEHAEKIIGYTLNTLCLRCLVGKGDPFEKIVRHVSSKIRQSLAHQLYPFEEVLKDHKSDRSMLLNGLFNVLVLYQNYPSTGLELMDCACERETFTVRDGFIDLVIEFAEEPNSLRVLINYNKNHYSHYSVKGMFGHLINLLRSAAENMAEEAGRLRLLTAQEERMLFPAVAREWDVKHIKLPVHVLFEMRAAARPDTIAIQTSDQALSYKTLNARCNSLAAYLKNGWHLQPDDKIGFMTGRSANVVIAMLSILKAGAAYVAIDPSLPAARVKYIAEDSGIKCFLTDHSLPDGIKGLFEEDLIVDIDDPGIYLSGTDNLPWRGAMKDLAYVIYTSGSTGLPKGVMIEHESLFGYVRQFIGYFEIVPEDIFIQHASISFDIVVEEIFPALCCSAGIVIAENEASDVSGLFKRLCEHGVTIFTTTPLILRELNRSDGLECLSLRTVISGGDILHPSDIDRIPGHADLYNSYGPSESTVCATYKKLRSSDDCYLIGKPIAGRWIYILDEDLQVVPPGMPGEICIWGGLSRGYINLPGLTDEKFINNPYGPGKLFRSGDRGRWTEAGEIEFIGRTDLQCKIRGHRVEIEEVEAVIKQYSLVVNAGVIASEGKAFLIGFLVVKAGFDEGIFRLYLSEHLPPYMVPAKLLYAEKLPLTSGGKIDRMALKAPEAENDSEKEESSDTDGLEEKLILIISDILNSGKIGASTNLFDFGCNSIVAGRIAKQLFERCGYKTGIRDIFIYPTVRLLAKHLRRSTAGMYEAISLGIRADSYPLSDFQKGIWLECQMDKRSYSYNETEIYELKGEVVVEAVRGAVEGLIRRHDILRTVFRVSGGEPKQVVVEPLVTGFCYLDISDVESPGEKAVELWEEQQRRPFNLESGPLHRWILLKTADREFFLVVIIHHLLIDDWSGGILMREFVDLYERIRQGEETRNERPRLQFSDYVNWVEWQKGHQRQMAGRKYWSGLYGDGTSYPDLPDDRQPGLEKSYESGLLYSTLDRELTEALMGHCRKQELSLFMLLLTGMALLFYRYTNSDDLVIATPVSRRDHPDLTDIPGPLINIIALRIRIDRKCSCLRLSDIVKEAMLGAHEHSYYSYNQLIGDLREDGRLSRPFLYELLLNLNEHSEQLLPDPEGITIKKVHKRIAGNKGGFGFYFEKKQGVLSVAIEYDKGRFSRERIERMLAHYKNVLTGMTERPFELIDRIDYLTDGEKHRLFAQYNKPNIELPSGNIVGLFIEQASRAPMNTCIICGGRQLTYAEVNEYSDALANYLDERYAPQGPISLIMDRSEDIIICILAVWKLGLSYIPIEPTMPVQRISFMVRNAGSCLIIYDKGWDAGFIQPEMAYKQVDIFALDWTEVGKQRSDRGNAECTDADVAYIMYTSGSSGEPKAVEIRSESVLNLLFSLKKAPGMVAGDVMLSVSSYAFDISVAEYFFPLIAGGVVVLATREEVLDVKKLIGLMEAYGPSVMQATPSLWNSIVEGGWRGNAGLKVISCGEPLHDMLKRKLLNLGGELWNFYGPTETTIFSTGKRITDAEEIVTIGSPIDNTLAYILDGCKCPAPIGVFGELHIGGVGVARGYVKQPKLNEERFLTIEGFPGTVYATGDLCRWLDNGTIEYKARIDLQIKVRGYRIEPGEVENAIISSGLVEYAAVLIEGHNQGDASLAAYVVYKVNVRNAERALRKALHEKLPEYMVPDRFYAIEAMPFTTSGKINRKLLSSVKSTPGSDDLSVPGTETERRLLAIWQELIGRSEIGIRDSFFEIGGHSLRANKMINRVYEEFGVELSFSDIFIHSTIERISELISRRKEHTHTSIIIE